MNSSFCNVVKLPSTGSNTTIDWVTVEPEYPRVCDFCRDTYNSELTFLRHKETGKCFRFCRLREENTVKTRKSKTILYPRNCERCGKTYKNKTSFFRHKRHSPNCKRVEIVHRTPRAQLSTLDGDEISTETEFVDVVDLTNDDVAVVDTDKYTNNKENINDFDSNFIIALDVDNNYKNFNSLYPRICEFCHKLFKCEESFQRHRSTKCCRAGKNPKMSRREITFPRKCPSCRKTFCNRQSYVKHRNRCESCQKKMYSVTDGEGLDAFPLRSNSHRIRSRTSVKSQRNILQTSSSMSDEMSYSLNQIYYDLKNCNVDVAATDDAAPKPPESVSEHRSIYPRTCEFCGFVFRSKFPFHRHKKKCPGYTNFGKSGVDALYPRRCVCCSQIFVSHQAFQLHRKYLEAATTAQAAPATDADSSLSTNNTNTNDDDDHVPIPVVPMLRSHNSKTATRQILKCGTRVIYPRTCTKCGQTYAGKQSFCNHKKYCKKFRKVNEALYEEYGSDKDSEELDKDEALLYPRTCKFCLKTYARKQSFYHHKRICTGYLSSMRTVSKDDVVRKSMYPRVCLICRKTYSSKQTFYVHAKLCPIKSDAAVETLAATEPVMLEIDANEEDHSEELEQHHNHHQQQNQPQQNEENYEDVNDNDDYLESVTPTAQGHAIVINVRTPISTCKNTYPKMCKVCRRIYACRQTFSRHKKKCALPRTSNNGGVCGVGVVLVVQKETYPKECEYCRGTFKCASTFNAHRVRCEFFETSISESRVTALRRTNCERCRHILTQSRRTLHQHLTECHDPFVNDACGGSTRGATIVNAKSDDENEDGNKEEESATETVQQDVDSAASTGGICECCGIFFDTADLLQQHIHAKESVSDVVNENPWQYNVKPPLTLISLASPPIKTYPRFCECCGKIYKTKQTFYNHKKNCHIYCFKYFIAKECGNCALPFKCEKLFAEHVKTCVKLVPKNEILVGAESDVPCDMDRIT